MKNIKRIDEFFDFFKKDKEFRVGDKFRDKDFGDSELEILLISDNNKKVRVKFNIIEGRKSDTNKTYEISVDTLFRDYQKI
jgi:hypothetical protein